MKFSSIINRNIPLRTFSDNILSYSNFIQKHNDCTKCQLFSISSQIEEMICKPCRAEQVTNSHRQEVNLLQGDIYEHSQKVSYLSFVLGKNLGLDENQLEKLKLASLYHDIGKTKIPSYIINKPGPLTESEWRIMKSHATLGYQILLKDDELKEIANYVKHHHERCDGSGYPDGLKRDQIPMIYRIIAVVDAYDAMTSNRPYRRALEEENAIQELVSNAKTQFDEKIVHVFVNQVLH